jgi:methionine sulfoxide reductase heme-binding subunit
MTETTLVPSPLARIWHSNWFFWLLLSIPALPMIYDMAISGRFRGVLHESGEFGARFTIIALMLTPLIMLFPKVRALRWLMKRRRYIGVAAFGYSAVHTFAYLVQKGSLSAAMSELAVLGIWTGWVAFLVFIPLAITSNDWSLRTMGPSWKTLQRFTYVAAIFTALHWYTVEYQLGGVLVHFLPLALLETYRIWRYFSCRSVIN